MAKKLRTSTAKRRLLSYIYLLINTVCWGAALVIVKPSLAITTPTRYLLYRYALATLLSLPFIYFYWKNIKHKLRTITTITLIELLGTTVALLILYTGLSLTGAIEASLIGTTGPLFVVIAGVLLLKEREEKHEWLGLGLSFIGTLLIVTVPIINGTLTQASSQPAYAERSLLGNGLIMFYNVINAYYYILAKKHYQKMPKLFTSSISFVVGLISFLLIALLEAQANIPMLISAVQRDLEYPSVWIAATYMAIFGSIIGLTAYIKGQNDIEASEASLFSYLQPLVYLPLGFLLLKESISWWAILGLSLVIVGVWFAQRKTKSIRKT